MPVRRTSNSSAPVSGLVDQLIRSKRKTIAIIVQRDGLVIVRAPLKEPERMIHSFIESKSDWITEKKLQAAQLPALPVRQFAEGELFLLLGKQIPLHLVKSQPTALALQDSGFSISVKALPRARVVFEQWYKAQAGKVLNERTQLFASRHGFQYEKIRISSARTRWGSCSSRGTLSFTWRLVMAPLNVVDYVVIHELAHLKIKNHSAVFWTEVARLLPDYKRHRDWLKKNGQHLTLDGDA